MRSPLLAAVVASSISLVACVPQNRYDRMAEAGQEARKEAHRATEQAASLKVALDRANADVVARDHALEEREERVSSLATDLHNAEAKLEETQAINGALRGELTRLVADVERLRKEKDDAQKELDALKKSCGQDEVAPPKKDGEDARPAKDGEAPAPKVEVAPNP